MKYIKSYNESAGARFNKASLQDKKYSDRDMTNKYLTTKGWVRYLDTYLDIYTIIEKEFGITCDEIGFAITELVEEFDLIYSCQINNDGDEGEEPLEKISGDYIVIDLHPSQISRFTQKDINYRDYLIKKGLVFPKSVYGGLDSIPESGIGGILDNIDDYISDKGLTIRNRGSFEFYSTSSAITLIMKKVN